MPPMAASMSGTDGLIPAMEIGLSRYGAAATSLSQKTRTPNETPRTAGHTAGLVPGWGFEQPPALPAAQWAMLAVLRTLGGRGHDDRAELQTASAQHGS